VQYHHLTHQKKAFQLLVTFLLLFSVASAFAHEKPLPAYATQITAENFQQAIRGSSAIAGIGDWMLSNGTLCASISDPSHETYLSHRGGALVDIGFCGRNDDRWHTYHELFNLSRDSILPAASIRTESDAHQATIVVSGEIAGVQNETRYRMEVDRPAELQIETRLTRISASDKLFLFGALVLHPHRSLTPYANSFHHPFVDTTDKLAMLKVMFPTNRHVLVGPDHLPNPITYTLENISAEHIDRAGKHTPLRQFAINSDEFTLLGNFTNALWVDTEGQPGLLQFAQTPFMDIAVGESLLIRKRIRVSPRSEHPAGTTAAKPATATLQLPAGKVMHLVFKGIDGTGDPVLFPDTLDFRVGDIRFERDISSNRFSLTGTKNDLQELSLPPGHYRVYALRGPEYSLAKTDITLRAGETATLVMDTPKRVVDTPGWIAADFHVHSEYSFDSTLPVQQRIGDFLSQGGEVMVSSEHKNTVDFAPFIHAMGLQQQLVAITGVELSGMAHTPKIPRTIGHSNVFPVQAQPQQFLGGTLPHENLRLGEIIGAYKQRYPDSVLQLNHPRAAATPDADIHFLDHLSINKPYDPTLPLKDEQNSSLLETHAGSLYQDIDFDAMELLNGEDIASYERVRADWFSFLQQGYKKTGTANSDSHRAGQLVALPRNYVHVHNDAIKPFDQHGFIQAIHSGDLIGSTGPLLDITLEGQRMGGTFVGKSGTLNIDVRSAGWIPVDSLNVYVNGKLAHRQGIPGAGRYSVPLTFTADGFVTVEVKGKAGADYAAVYPGFYPFAFSNPVYVQLK
jgi:hypothetical protein